MKGDVKGMFFVLFLCVQVSVGGLRHCSSVQGSAYEENAFHVRREKERQHFMQRRKSHIKTVSGF